MSLKKINFIADSIYWIVSFVWFACIIIFLHLNLVKNNETIRDMNEIQRVEALPTESRFEYLGVEPAALYYQLWDSPEFVSTREIHMNSPITWEDYLYCIWWDGEYTLESSYTRSSISPWLWHQTKRRVYNGLLPRETIDWPFISTQCYLRSVIQMCQEIQGRDICKTDTHVWWLFYFL